LNIELDGSQHGFPEQQASDRQRDADLRHHGIHVMRFWNWRVRREKQVIRDAIWKALQERAPHPLPDYCRPMPPPELPQPPPTQRTRGNAAYGARQLEEELREGEEADQDPGRD
jgi:hypothetical protein